MKGLHTIKSNGRTYCYAWRGGPRIDAEFGTSDFTEAFARLKTARRPEQEEGRARESLKVYARANLARGAIKRARLANLACDIDAAYIVDLLVSQNFRCALTQIPLSMTKTGARTNIFRLPFRPSIDRVEPGRGYVKDNVRILCYAVNVALNDWGEDVLMRIATALTKGVE